MRAFDDPVDLVVYMLEKARAIALLKALENRSDVIFGNHEILLCICEQLLARSRTDCPAPKLRTGGFIRPIYDRGECDLFWRWPWSCATSDIFWPSPRSGISLERRPRLVSASRRLASRSRTWKERSVRRCSIAWPTVRSLPRRAERS